ncbi:MULTISPECIES: hypothetical protein [unclassified Herbaspirillum]|uniref:hypothetical protein n=1 Tax=unclassified Herbaspirillum TaxID=2624150 RepID=UPI00114FE09A|nr:MULTISPECIES: hypothetical protein [unclassified Herbaspirillum]MBB5393201.1 hypothetical protein [Herbaspirillum sp. SJZ102]
MIQACLLRDVCHASPMGSILIPMRICGAKKIINARALAMAWKMLAHGANAVQLSRNFSVALTEVRVQRRSTAIEAQRKTLDPGLRRDDELQMEGLTEQH